MNKVKRVQIRNGFSDRNKIHPINTEIQLHSLDERTRNALANLIGDWFSEGIFSHFQNQFFLSLVKDAYCEYVSSDEYEDIAYNSEIYFNRYILEPLLEGEYDDVLSLVEFVTNYLVNWKRDYYSKSGSDQNQSYLPEYESELNQVFEKEFVGYRYLHPYIVPISDQIELDAIKEAAQNKYEGCRNHISKALELISNREHPDYKNSIKESVSAVESICKIITDDDKATLGSALNKLKSSELNLHPAMCEAFSKLYGYTSDQGGIRNAEGMLTSNVSFEEAKYMLVSCCAFVNFLTAEEAKK